MKREFILASLIVIAVLLSGCAGSGQTDASGGAAASGGPASQFTGEYRQGVAHHTTARDSFDSATSFWDNGDYSGAVAGYMDAAREYELASDHYRNMEQFAANRSDRDFAETISQCAYALSLASGNFADAANASESGNLTSAYVYFQRGQQSVNQSDAMLDQSLGLMPGWLEGT
jgi:hypothetical protein